MKLALCCLAGVLVVVGLYTYDNPFAEERMRKGQNEALKEGMETINQAKEANLTCVPWGLQYPFEDCKRLLPRVRSNTLLREALLKMGLPVVPTSSSTGKEIGGRVFPGAILVYTSSSDEEIVAFLTRLE